MTGSSAREREKGPGKWTASGRDVETLMADLPDGPTRELDIDTKPRSRGLGSYVLVVVVLATGAALWAWLG
ncbi:MAG: hypothetical protein ACK4YP_13115 [Myxococcota bacterium]